MEARSIRALIGAAMIGLGLLQAAIYGTQSEWIPTTFGLLFSSIGLAYLWAEVYSVKK